jgi:hypothetical protein
MSVLAPDANLVVLDKAAKALREHLVQDAARVPEIGETIYTGLLLFFLTVSCQDVSCLPSVFCSLPCVAASSSAYAAPPSEAWAPFYKRKAITIPEGLFDQYERAFFSSHCLINAVC